MAVDLDLVTSHKVKHTQLFSSFLSVAALKAPREETQGLSHFSQREKNKQKKKSKLTIFADGADHAGSRLQVVADHAAGAVAVTRALTVLAAVVTPVGAARVRLERCK